MATTEGKVPQVSSLFSLEEVRTYQELVHRIPVSRHVVSYAVSLSRATRPDDLDASTYTKNYISWGAGPRASQHMILGAKAMALLDGQPTVTAEHIRQIAPLVLRHRILPSYNATGEGLNSADLVRHIIDSVSEPIYVA